MSNDPKAGSWLPDDFTEGGFFDDKDGTIIAAEVVPFDYNGKQADDPVCALHIRIHPDDADDDSADRSEYYPMGKLTKFTPSADKKFYTSEAGTAMNKKSKCALFLRALADKGFDMSKLQTGIDGMVGLHAHFNIVPMPEINDGEKREKKPTILIVTKILGDAKAPKAAAKKPTAAAPAAKTTEVKAEVADAGELGTKLEGAILEILGAAEGNKVAKGGLTAKLFKAFTDGTERNAALKLTATDWMTSEDRPWTVEGGEVKIRG